MERWNVDIKQGLNTDQINQRKREGLVNVTDNNTTKSYRQILSDNLFTLFNLINVILAVLILWTGSYKNLMFMGVVISNIIIGTFQEIRAKKTLDKISLIHTMKVNAVRNGQNTQLGIEEIVLDDILKVKTGHQMVCDCVLKEGMLEMDESLLTGESHNVIKNPGDFLYSGSFVVGGNGTIQVEKVGNDSYASQMIKDVKKQNRYPSELKDLLNKIIKWIGIAIIPIGLILFWKHFFVLHQPLNECILSISAALIGMIPEGLVILTSIALAVGVINLAKHRTLVQELYCIETLARVDVLCLDKTGTITEGKMIVDKITDHVDNLEEILKNMTYDLQDDNATMCAIRQAFPPKSTFKCTQTIPFNSSKKYSGVIYEDAIYIMGAYSFMMNNIQQEELNKIEGYSKEGYRVISVAKTDASDTDFTHLQLIGNILLLDKIRDSAKETLEYFKNQNVDIKIISGDHPITVSQIAKRVGIEHYDAYVDATTLTDEDINEAVNRYQIFGRVTPDQKKKLVTALKAQGHTVGMTGDGVNDVLAFKKADVSIAMASGSDVAKSSANLVLLDSNFDALPEVLYEGRRVINNIQRVATLFLTKTIFSALLALMTIFLPFEYPFVPIHLTFVSSFTIGIPAFFMALEPNRNRVEKKFMENILSISLPAGISVIVCILLVELLGSMKGYDAALITQLCVITIALNGCIVLTKVSYPFTTLRKVILVLAYIGIAIGLFFFEKVLSIQSVQLNQIFLETVVIIAMLLVISKLGSIFVKKFYQKYPAS